MESRGVLGHCALLNVSGELRAQRPCSLYRWAFRPVRTDGGRRGKAACCRASRTHPPGRQSRYSRNGIRKSQQSCGTGPCRGGEERLADGIRTVPMERLRFITSLIGCLQASERRRQARKALFNSQAIPSGGSNVIASLISLILQPSHACPDVCRRRLGGALWFLGEPLAEEGRKALQCRAGGTRGWREEGRSISFGNVGEWPFPLMRGRLFASSA